jgi:hypothetical protein
MNRIQIETRRYSYAIDGRTMPDPAVQAEFLIDDASLGERFGFEDGRPWFGRTAFDDTPALRAAQLLQLRGLVPASNQFGTTRFVLYRCHCGADDCGVISCKIIRDDDTVEWRDIRSEDDGEFDLVIPSLRFDAAAYDAAIEAYVALRDSDCT